MQWNKLTFAVVGACYFWANAALAQTSIPTKLDLSSDARAEIREAVIAKRTFQPSPKDFEAKLGAEVSSSLTLHPFPRVLFSDYPELRNLTYAHTSKDIVIVNAVKKQIVQVIPLDPSQKRVDSPPARSAAESAVGGMKGITSDVLARIYGKVTTEPQSVPAGQALMVGVVVPDSIVLNPVSTEDLPGNPYHGAKLRDGRVVLTDAKNRRIVGVITRYEGDIATTGQAVQPTTEPSPGGNNPVDPLIKLPNSYMHPSDGHQNEDRR